MSKCFRLWSKKETTFSRHNLQNLLDFQLFNGIVLPLLRFYRETGRLDMAYELFGKDLEVWKASGNMMSMSLEKATESHRIENYENGNTYYETVNMIDVIENKRRFLIKIDQIGGKMGDEKNHRGCEKASE